MNRKRDHFAPVFAGVVCWLLLAVSAAFPAFHIAADIHGGGHSGNYYGWALLFLGWYGIVWKITGATFGWGVLAWCANPCFVLATMTMMARQYRVAIPAGAAAVAFALTSFQLREIQAGDLVPGGPIDHYGAGFFLWLAAMALSLAAPASLAYLTGGTRPTADESQRAIEAGPENAP